MALSFAPGATGRLLFQLAILICLSSIAAASFHAFSESDKAAAEDFFVAGEDGISSLEETYQALRSLQVLGSKLEESNTCMRVTETLSSSSEEIKQIFYAVKIAEILHCQLAEAELTVAVPKIVSSLKDSSSLLDFYFSIGTLAFIKKQNWITDNLVLEDTVSTFNAIKALGQSDGTWKYSTNEGESSAKAAGIALETLAGLVSLAGSNIEEHMISHIKGAASKLFDTIESYDDGAHYFDEKKVDMLSGGGSSLAATSCVVRGVTVLAAVVPGRLKISAEKIVGLAKFFLSLGVPGSRTEAFYVLDALGSLEANSLVVPLVLSVPSSVLSLTSRDLLEVHVTTVLGSPIPARVTLVKAIKAESKKTPILSNQDLESDAEKLVHKLDLLANKVDLGKYDLTFEVKPLDKVKYSAGGPTSSHIIVTGLVMVPNVEVGVLDSDTGSPEFLKKLNPSTKDTVSLFATHLQKFRLSLDVFSPFNEPFRPHQVFVKLRHESGVEHLFLVKTSGKRSELNLDFLGLVEKLQYLSGAYTIELVVGDATMENSFAWVLGTIELDLPEPSEGAAKSSTARDIYSKYGPRLEITHVFRQPEKRPPPQLSNAFLVLILLPLIGFLVGLRLLNVNVKSFPVSGLPMFTALVFHGGIMGVLGLYFLFWLKFNLFTTLKYLGILGISLVLPGHHILSYLADSSSKIKTA